MNDWNDKEFGRIRIKEHRLARRISFRIKPDGMHATVPAGLALPDFVRALDRLRPRLRTAFDSRGERRIDFRFELKADLFSLRLVPAATTRFSLKTDGNEVLLVCPADTDFGQEGRQDWLRKVIEEALRKRAKAVLPPLLQTLSETHGLPYRAVRINAGKSRWGSCSSRKNINLSCYLLLLPVRLVRYVMLHELTHTLEMNHGPRFWQALDALTEGRSDEWCEELKKYHAEF